MQFQTDALAELITFDLGKHSHLFQETRGLRVSWVEANRELRVVWKAGMPSPMGHTHFCFRVGLSHEAPNAADVPHDFTVELSDGRTAYRVAIREQIELISPDTGRPYAPDVEPKTVMQTVRIPFARLVQGGVDPARVGSMRLFFDRRPKGILYMDDLHFSREWDGGIYFKVYNPRFFTKHGGKPVRVSVDGIRFEDTGLAFPSSPPEQAPRPSDTARLLNLR